MPSDHSDNPDVPPVHVARPRPYRARRALWGIGALAMSPDAVPEGPRRRRLLRAATLTSAMGIAWASTASGAPPSRNAPGFDHIGLPSVDADEESTRLSSPLPGPWQRMHDTDSSEPDVVEPGSDAATASPGVANRKARKREQASEVAAKREARPSRDQGQTKGADADNGAKRGGAQARAGDAVPKDRKPDTAPQGDRAPTKGEKKPAASEGATKKPVADSGKPVADSGKPTKQTGNPRVRRPKDAASDERDGEDAAGKAGRRATGKDAPVRTAQKSGAVSAAPDPDARRTNVVASHEQVDFVQMSDKTVLVGFHEAAMPGAKPLAVASTPDADHGRGQVSFSNVDDPLHAVILPTRARAANAASAMDVVIPAREAVFAPVTGTVTEVDHYQLYGRYPDNRMVIVPDARPDLRVVILHIEGLKVGPGDKVTAGQTRIAVGANPFPFESQVDRFARPLMAKKGDATPHAHVELR